MKIKVMTVYCETLVVHDKMDYLVWCNDCTINVTREKYGMDADGRRGVNKLWITDTQVNIDDIKCDVGFPESKMTEAKKALEEALYKVDYFNEL